MGPDCLGLGAQVSIPASGEQCAPFLPSTSAAWFLVSGGMCLDADGEKMPSVRRTWARWSGAKQTENRWI